MARDDDRRVRPFMDVFREIDKGRVHDEASLGLRDLVEQVRATGKGGTVIIKIDVKPESDDMVKVEAVVTTKVPRPKAKASLYFVTDESNLTRSNPGQDALPLREVPGEQPATDETPASGRSARSAR